MSSGREQKTLAAISSRGRRRITSYLVAPTGTIHKEIANLSDKADESYVEKRFKRPLFRSEEERAGYLTFLHQGEEMKSSELLARSPLIDFRDLLRKGWARGENAVEKIKLLAQVASSWSLARGSIEITCENLLGTASILFLRDYVKKHLGRCANPECTEPYFVRSKSTQRFCDHEKCQTYSALLTKRQSWKKHGKEWRRRG